MADGKLVKMLLHTKVTRYLEWKCVDASYVCQHQKGGMFSSEKMAVCKVPADEMEAAKSSLMGMFEKTRLVKFINYLLKLELSDKKTWGDLDLNKVPMS